jgi:hypothetical protein
VANPDFNLVETTGANTDLSMELSSRAIELQLVPARRDRSCEGSSIDASFDKVYRELGAAADWDTSLFPAPTLENFIVQRRCQVYVGVGDGGGRYRILLLRLTHAMKQNNRQHRGSDSHQFSRNPVAHQETILWECFFISKEVTGNAFGTVVLIPSLLQQTLQRGLVVPIPHTYILPVMIYRQLDRFLFIIENLFSGQLND